MKLTLRWTCRFERFLVSMIFQFLCFDSAVCSCSRQQKVKSLKPPMKWIKANWAVRMIGFCFRKLHFVRDAEPLHSITQNPARGNFSIRSRARRKKWNCFPSGDSWRRHSVISIILRSHVSCARVVRRRRYRAATQISYSINFRWKQKGFSEAHERSRNNNKASSRREKIKFKNLASVGAALARG